MKFIKILVVAMLSWSTGVVAASALSKVEADRCVSKAVGTFMAGEDVSRYVDIEFLKQREYISADTNTIRKLLKERSLKNKDRFEVTYLKITGQPRDTSNYPGWYRMDGRVKGYDNEDKKKIDYRFGVWMFEAGCRIGVLEVEEVFRLGVWVKNNL